MIIGGSKKQVLKNIKLALKDEDYNRKVEEGDPVLSDDEKAKAVERFFELRDKKGFALKQRAMIKMADLQLKKMSENIEIVGAENFKKVLEAGKGVIITSNHFNPLDNLVIRKLVCTMNGRCMYIVIQDTNVAMEGVIGDLMNYMPNIPIMKSAKYIKNTFLPEMKRALDGGGAVLIYPEEEMWFNYRKPRPEKRGAFHFAAELNVPIVPCFVEMENLDKLDNEEFLELKYRLHVMEPIWPDKKLSVRQNSIEMAKKDYAVKCEAYEKAYGKKLTYEFEEDDIAGWRG